MRHIPRSDPGSDLGLERERFADRCLRIANAPATPTTPIKVPLQATFQKNASGFASRRTTSTRPPRFPPTRISPSSASCTSSAHSTIADEQNTNPTHNPPRPALFESGLASGRTSDTSVPRVLHGLSFVKTKQPFLPASSGSPASPRQVSPDPGGVIDSLLVAGLLTGR